LQEIVPEHKLVPLKKTEALSVGLSAFLGSCTYYASNKWFNKQEQSSVKVNKGLFSFVRTGKLDHCRTSQLANEIGFFQRVFAEKPSPLCILFWI